MDFTDKVVIITGASSGIGAGAAEHLSKLGAKLVLTGRNEENLKKTVAKCKGEVLAVVSDVNVETDRVKVIDETIKKFGKIDVLVNNAGIGEGGDLLTTTMDQYDNVMNTNVRSVFHLTQLVSPHLIKTKGNIVNISSVAGLRAFAGFTAYCMSKAAIDQFTRCVALELAPNGVRVNAVNPAVILTEFQKRMGMDETAYQAYLVHARTTHALGRVGTVEDTAHAIAFLACNTTSSFITGTTLAVDGGKAIMCPR
jgi:NAD(P)-dependent dehydrogenase (short-subunit alcohol dehydrogenase family)